MGLWVSDNPDTQWLWVSYPQEGCWMVESGDSTGAVLQYEGDLGGARQPHPPFWDCDQRLQRLPLGAGAKPEFLWSQTEL